MKQTKILQKRFKNKWYRKIAEEIPGPNNKVLRETVKKRG